MGNSNMFAVLLLFILLPVSVLAQEPDTLSFNALEYSMQKRYRPGNAGFVSGKLSLIHI